MTQGVDLHSEHGALSGEHPGRSRNPVIKVLDIAWLEFEKPDLLRAEAFARAFGFHTALRTPDEVQLRGTDAGASCVILRRGQRTRFTGVAFRAGDEVDVLRLADKSGTSVRPLPEAIGGLSVDLVDPSGMAVHVVTGFPHSPQWRVADRQSRNRPVERGEVRQRYTQRLCRMRRSCPSR